MEIAERRGAVPTGIVRLALVASPMTFRTIRRVPGGIIGNNVFFSLLDSPCVLAVPAVPR